MDLDLLDGEDETPAGESEETPTPAAPPVDVDGAVARALDARLGQFGSQLDQTLGHLSQRLAAIETARATPPPGDDGESAFERFAKDPNGALASVVNEVVEKQISPALQAALDSTHKMIMREEIRALEKSHGEGAYDEIRGIVEAGINALAPAQRANPEMIQTIFRASLGQDPVRAKMAEREAKASKSNPASLLPNGVSVSESRAQLTDSDVRYLESTGGDRRVMEAIANAAAKAGGPPKTLSEMRAAVAAGRTKGKK